MGNQGLGGRSWQRCQIVYVLFWSSSAATSHAHSRWTVNSLTPVDPAGLDYGQIQAHLNDSRYRYTEYMENQVSKFTTNVSFAFSILDDVGGPDQWLNTTDEVGRLLGGTERTERQVPYSRCGLIQLDQF